MTAAAGWVVPEHVGIVETVAATFVAALPDGPLLVLDERADLIWRTAPQTSTSAQLAAEVAAAYGLDVAVVAADVTDCVCELVAAGVLAATAEPR